jgi:hypothetical protein
LAVLVVQTGRIPILEEIVQASAIREDVGAVDDAKTPGPWTVEGCALFEAGVGISILYSVWRQSGGVALVVSGFMLDQAHEDVIGMRDLVVVEDIVFG